MHTALLSSLPRIVLSALFGIVAMSFILFLFRMMMQALDSPFTSLSGEPGIYQPKRLNEDNNADLSVSVAAQDVLRRNDGQPFELTFTSGLPAAGTSTGPRLYITRDGSVHAGDILWSSGKQVVRTTNPAGGLHTVFDIPVSQVVGYASAGPRQL